MSTGAHRWAILLVVLSAGLGCTAAPALASGVTSSQITSPTSPFDSYYDDDLGSSDPANQVEVTGTSDGTTGDKVDIVCTYTYRGHRRSVKLASAVAVDATGNFDATGVTTPASDWDAECILRAVPAGSDATTEDLTPFAGPTVYGSYKQTYSISGGPNDGTVDDYYLSQSQTAGYDEYDSLGSCGLYGAPLSGPSLGDELFDCNDYLWSYSAVRYGAMIDGVSAWPPNGAAERQILAPSGSGGSSTEGRRLAGAPSLTYTRAVDPTTHDLTITESDPFVVCAPEAATFPPTTTSCTQWASAGVTDDRTIVQNHDGQQISIRDVFRSTDGRAHSLDLLFENDFQSNLNQPVFRFPWAGNVYAPQDNATVVQGSPTSPSTIYVKDDAYAPDGSSDLPHGAITFGQPVSDFVFGDTVMWPHFQRTVPAGGSVELDAVYSQGTSEAAVDALAAEAEAQFPHTGPPATPATPAPAPPAASRSGRQRPRALTLRVAPHRRSHVPAEFTVQGRLELRTPTAARTACRSGAVAVLVKAGRDTISDRRARLRADCTYRLRVTFHSARRLGRGRLRLIGRFVGNAALSPIASHSVFVRIGRGHGR